MYHQRYQDIVFVIDRNLGGINIIYKRNSGGVL